MSSLKRLNNADVVELPYIANKLWSYTACEINNNRILVYTGKKMSGKFDSKNELKFNGEYERLVYDSINHLFYQSFSGSYIDINTSLSSLYYIDPSVYRPSGSYENYTPVGYMEKNFPDYLSISNQYIKSIYLESFSKVIIEYNTLISCIDFSGWSFIINGISWPITSIKIESNRQIFYMEYNANSSDTISVSFDNITGNTEILPGAFLLPSFNYYEVYNKLDDPNRIIPTLPLSSSDAEIKVLSFPQDIYGTSINPGSFIVSASSYYLIDDKKGNIYDISGSSNILVGNIFYKHGIAVITHQDYQTLFPIPPYAKDDYFEFKPSTTPKIVYPLLNDSAKYWTIDTGSVVLSGSNSSMFTVSSSGALTFSGSVPGIYDVYYKFTSISPDLGCTLDSNYGKLTVNVKTPNCYFKLVAENNNDCRLLGGIAGLIGPTPTPNPTATLTATPITTGPTSTPNPTGTPVPTPTTSLTPTATTPSPTPTPTDTVITYAEYAGSGYGNTPAEACGDATTNPKSLYSNCLGSITTGCIIYPLSTGRGGPLTGYSHVFIDGSLRLINSETGEITGLAPIQC